MGRGKCDQTGAAAGRRQPRWVLAQPHEPNLSQKQRLWLALGGRVVLQRPETHDGFDAQFPQTQSTAGRSRLQGAGLHPPPLGEYKLIQMFSTEQKPVKSKPGGYSASGTASP